MKIKFLVTIIIFSFLKLYNCKPNVKITGGDEVVPHSLPYQVGLLIPTSGGTSFCGGALINPTTILTSASCGSLSGNVEVLLGTHNIRKVEPEQIRVASTQILIHPQWNYLLLMNDIAIVKIPTVTLTDVIQPIPLPTDPDKTYEGDLAKGSGWGKDADDAANLSDVLRFVEFTVFSNEECYHWYQPLIRDTNICTDGRLGRNMCQGDGGGPLAASTGELIGIASYGNGQTCEMGFPNVFTRVSKYLDWISENSN